MKKKILKFDGYEIRIEYTDNIIDRILGKLTNKYDSFVISLGRIYDKMVVSGSSTLVGNIKEAQYQVNCMNKVFEINTFSECFDKSLTFDEIN
jgi:hypothetical protein